MEDVQQENILKYKPVIEAQNEVKNISDKKQDNMIKALGNNQQELIQSVNVLSDVISN